MLGVVPHVSYAGMSSEPEVAACVGACDPEIIFHTNSTYPAPADELNLNYIKVRPAAYLPLPPRAPRATKMGCSSDGSTRARAHCAIVLLECST